MKVFSSPEILGVLYLPDRKKDTPTHHRYLYRLPFPLLIPSFHKLGNAENNEISETTTLPEFKLQLCFCGMEESLKKWFLLNFLKSTSNFNNQKILNILNSQSDHCILQFPIFHSISRHNSTILSILTRFIGIGISCKSAIA